MNLNIKFFLMFCIGLILIGCSSPQYKAGDSFFRDIDASGKNPTYYKEGVYQGSDFFVVNPYWQKYEKQAGLLVRGDKVVEPLTQVDISKIRTALAQQRNAGNESVESKKQTGEQNLQSQKKQYDKNLANQKLNLKSRVDVVAQVLNYSSGCKDEGCDTYTWAAKEGQKCIYEKVNISGGGESLYGTLQSLITMISESDSPASKYVGSASNEINLNDLDPKSIQIATKIVTNSEFKRCSIRDSVTKRCVGEPDRYEQTTLQIQVVDYMGKQLFGATNLDINRLKRGWSLIYSKHCSGTKKAF